MNEDSSPFGSSFESFLEEHGILEETIEYAIKAAFVWQLTEAMKERGLSKRRFAELLGTSRTQLDRVLDPDNEGVTIDTLRKAAKVIGKEVHIELVDKKNRHLQAA